MHLLANKEVRCFEQVCTYFRSTYLEQNIPVADTQLQHQVFPRSQYTQCPTHCSCRSPLCLHCQCYLLPVVVDQLCKELFTIDVYKVLRKLQHHCRMYLHIPHQHQQSGGSCVTGLVCWDTPVAVWNLNYTGHHPGRFVHCQYQSGHCCMLCHLQFRKTVLLLPSIKIK